MKPFIAFLSKEVRKVPRDIPLAKSLVGDAQERYAAFFPPQKVNKFVFENGYEAIRELMAALLALRGFKSYSHQAPIAYLLQEEMLTEKEAGTLDHILYLRNASKYYGRKFAPDDLEEPLKSIQSLFQKILKILKEMMSEDPSKSLHQSG